jgi:hypothetical protein
MYNYLTMKNIIEPIDKNILEKELSEDKFFRYTNKGNNKIYKFRYFEAPKVMLEVARLRELSFRAAGGGSGAQLDIDTFDIMDNPYWQLIVWDPQEREIIGGYRYFLGNKSKFNSLNRPEISIADYFYLSNKFIHEYLPFSIELGRAFIQPAYQSSQQATKSIFALDNLWDGLGALIIEHPEMKYFFGKVTTYRDFNSDARDLLLHFMHTWFPDKQQLVIPINPISYKEPFLPAFQGIDYEQDFILLKKRMRLIGENIPPLFSAYMNLSPTLKTMGSALNPHLGDVDETAILLAINDIYPHKAERHIRSYLKEKGLDESSFFDQRLNERSVRVA